MPFNLTMSELAVVLVLALIFLGPKKLPELASGLGKMIREIKKVTAGVKEDIQLDENVRKPFEELREALTLPAEELKRRDDWKAEWEKRQEEEAAQAAAAETGNAESNADPASDTGTAGEPAASASSFGPEAGAEAQLPATGEGELSPPAKSTEPVAYERTKYAGASNADKTISTVAPTHVPEQVAAPLGDKTIVAPTPGQGEGAPAFRLPTAPPVGAVAASGRTIVGLPAAVRPTPPPPPPMAARLPLPKVNSARVVPKPESAPAASPPAASEPSSDDNTTNKA